MKICHLEGIIVSESQQGSGLATELLRRATQGADVLAFHTQSRKMLGLGRKVSVEDTHLAEQIAPVINTRNQDGIVDRRRYGGSCLYGDTKRFAGCAIEEVDWQNGDAYIFAGKVR